MAEPLTPFPYDGLPNEVKFMIWEEFVKAEPASRIVPLNVSVGDSVPEDDDTYWLALSIMPLKRLISPALVLDTISRKVALRHYRTRIHIYEMPMPIQWQSFEEWDEEWEEGMQNLSREQAGFWGQTVWASREGWSDRIEYWTTCRAASDMCSGPVEDDDIDTFGDDETNDDSIGDGVSVGGNESNSDSDSNSEGNDKSDSDKEDGEADDDVEYDIHRGCIYLDLATDRFLPFSQWDNIWARERSYYGLRELSDAITDFKYNGVALDESTFRDILARRPPVLRNASAHLSDEVLMGIRHVVFPSYPPPQPWNPSNPWPIEADPEQDITAINTPGTPLHAPKTWPAPSWTRTLPGAFGATPSSTMWGFAANDTLYRSFWDDIEDKGPEHLYIQRATRVNNASDPEDWDLVWGGGNANHDDGTSSDDSDDDGDSNDDGTDANSDEEGGNSSEEESDFDMGSYIDEGGFSDANSSDDDNDDESWE
ncbi:hypothetical protein PG985_016113 [Apiospora marii]|uniref:uncharacterized protein n=1 Tax=Apiospora marii TaxID=335849 RepID=UPI00312ED544